MGQGVWKLHIPFLKMGVMTLMLSGREPLCVSLLQHSSHLFGVRKQGSLRCFLPELIAFVGKCGIRACVLSSEGLCFFEQVVLEL